MEQQSDAMPTPPEKPRKPRRQFLLYLGIAMNAIAGILFIIPLGGFVGSALKRKKTTKWVSLGKINQFPSGQTRLASYRNPYVVPWDGFTSKVPCWVKHTAHNDFTVFAINCTHLGCPVRWFKESQLFLCPCHGGTYYADGERASGPPPRGLFTYPQKVTKGELWIKAGHLPTLHNPT